jgi:hypothetical protein
VPYFLQLFVEVALVRLDGAALRTMRPKRRVLLVRFLAKALLCPYYRWAGGWVWVGGRDRCYLRAGSAGLLTMCLLAKALLCPYYRWVCGCVGVGGCGVCMCVYEHACCSCAFLMCDTHVLVHCTGQGPAAPLPRLGGVQGGTGAEDRAVRGTTLYVMQHLSVPLDTS